MNTGSEPNTDEMIDLLLKLVPHTKVSHHEPGRITLKLSLSGLAKTHDGNYDGLMEKIPGILHTRTNLWSRSMDIDYDVEVLPYDLWESLIGLQKHPERSERVQSRLKKLLDN